MKKRFGIATLLAVVAMMALSLALAACSGGSFGVESDGTTVHAEATGSADGTATANITIPDGSGLCINHIVEHGSFHVKATDASGTVVFDGDINDNIADLIDVSGDIDLVLTANDAQGTIDIIAYDKEAQAQADATLDDALEQAAGKDAEELGLTKSSESA